MIVSMVKKTQSTGEYHRAAATFWQTLYESCIKDMLSRVGF